MGLEDAGEEVKVGQESFAGVEACAGVEAGGVVEDVQQDLLIGAARQPGVGAGVVLPKSAVVAGLPAFDGFGGEFVAGIGGELVFDGPTTDASAVGFEIATGETRRPGLGVALSAGEQVGGTQLVEAAHTDAQFERDRLGREQAGTGLREEMADQWRGYAMSQLVRELMFFIAPRYQEDGFIALELIPARASRAAPRQPDWPFIRLQTALGLRPRRALSSAEAKSLWTP